MRGIIVDKCKMSMRNVQNGNPARNNIIIPSFGRVKKKKKTVSYFYYFFSLSFPLNRTRTSQLHTPGSGMTELGYVITYYPVRPSIQHSRVIKCHTPVPRCPNDRGFEFVEIVEFEKNVLSACWPPFCSRPLYHLARLRALPVRFSRTYTKIGLFITYESLLKRIVATKLFTISLD